MRAAAPIALFVALVTLTGCGPGAAKTHPVRGRIEVPGADAGALVGSTVEARLDSDPNIRAAGTIEPDGTFRLETLQAGVIRPGAVAGNYQVRIVLIDDDRATRKKAAATVHPKVLKFETSGLTIRIPETEDVRLELPGRP